MVIIRLLDLHGKTNLMLNCDEEEVTKNKKVRKVKKKKKESKRHTIY